MSNPSPRPRWRTGRRQPRTLYLQLGDQPSPDDPMMGALDTADLAALVVEALNAYTGPLADIATSNWLVLCDMLVAARAEITGLRRDLDQSTGNSQSWQRERDAARVEAYTEYETKIRQGGELLAIVADLRRQLDERRLQTPDEWIAELMPGAEVVDPVGWRDKQLWTTRISRAEFQARIAQCTRETCQGFAMPDKPDLLAELDDPDA